MKVGDLVRFKVRGPGRDTLGFVIRVDDDWYGATQAFKIYKDVPRGCAIRTNMVDGIGPTKKGIRDRVLVMWSASARWEYCEHTELEVISESR